MSKSKKARKAEVDEARAKIQAEIESIKTMDFEQFRGAVSGMFSAFDSTWEEILDETGWQVRKFQDTVIKAVKKANRAEMDAALAAYEGLRDQTTMLEWCMYSIMLLFRKKVMHHTLSRADEDRIAALFLIDLDTVRKDEKMDMLWKLLEKETGTEKTKEDLDRQAILDAYHKNPEAFKTYLQVLSSGDQELIALLGKGMDRLKQGMDTDDEPEIIGADLQKMVADFTAKRQEAAHE
jgi:hypothetical protein